MRPLCSALVVCAALAMATSLQPVLADPAPDSDQLAAVNRRLSALTADQDAATTVAPAAEASSIHQAPALTPRISSASQRALPPFLTRPQITRLVAHFRQVDRVLHFQQRGMDVNLWGVFNRGRGLSIKYSRTF